ncbi:MAG: peptide chain release factor N(5)-glutamine methyltransferase [Chitinophagales bacterium]
MFLSYSRAFYELKNKLQPLYDDREAEALAHEILYFITGLDKTQRLLQKEMLFTIAQQEKYELAVTDLLSGKPLQYITGSAWFMGREFHVNEHVLIPRPETEELVQWIIDDRKNKAGNISILDIGTGSGCIPISLKLALSHADVTTCDISNDALNAAKKNADRLQASIQLLKLDFLDAAQRNKLANYDVIVSNPPYIPVSEKENLHTNVKDYEPGIALFVPDDDPLVFYKALALFGKEHLKPKGYIYCELDAGHAMECKAIFEECGYKEVLIKKDMNGKWRLLSAEKPQP